MLRVLIFIREMGSYLIPVGMGFMKRPKESAAGVNIKTRWGAACAVWAECGSAGALWKRMGCPQRAKQSPTRSHLVFPQEITKGNSLSLDLLN